MIRKNVKRYPVMLLLLLSSRAIALDLSTVGKAYDPGTNEILYTEYHCVTDDQRIVEYRDIEDKLIAHKIVNYSTGLLTPSFVQHNLNQGDMMKVEVIEDRVEMQRRVIEEGVDVNPQSKLLKLNLPLVIDAGFDNFIREYWNSLVQGEVITFQFPAAARVDLFDFKVNRMNCSSGDATQQCFNLRLDSWLLRMLVDPIELGYDKESRRLKRFQGLANIEDKNGNGYTVDIRYQYSDLPAKQCSASQAILEKWM